MEKLKTNLAELVKVKTIVTIVVLIVFLVLALRGDIEPDQVMVVTTTVIAFYFGTQHEKDVAADTVIATSVDTAELHTATDPPNASSAEHTDTFTDAPVTGFGG